MLEKLKKEYRELVILLRSIPSVVLSLFVVSVVAMNLLANKSINMNVDWLALDCGIIVSWLSFLSMDVIAKHFGPKASFEVSMVATLLNLLLCIIFFIASRIPGNWGESYVENGVIVNIALDNTFGGVWYIIFGSTVAFTVSALVNAFMNDFVGKRLKHDNFKSFALRSYTSTMIAQFIDNLTFAMIVSHTFFGWSFLQCFMCSLTGAVVELLFEIFLSPIGYRLCVNWTNDNVGVAYFDSQNSVKE